MRLWKQALCCAWIGAVIAPSAGKLCATTVQDLVRIRGHEPIMLQGMGIVVGLPGSGDSSKDSYAAARPYAQLLAEMGSPIASLEELAKADSYALVMVSMEIPATGARDGDRIDVNVEALFNAKGLDGGRLVVSPLWLPFPGERQKPPAALATGPIVIESSNRRAGVVRGGGQLVQSFPTQIVAAGGSISLVLREQYAGYPIAAALAEAINTDPALSVYTDLATVIDAQSIRVLLPPQERSDPANFLAAMLTLPIDPSLLQTKARIVINEKQGIIVVTGNVEIGPVGINAAGLTISSITPPPVPTPEDPVIQTTRWAGLDTTDGTSRSSTKLTDLLQALDQLNVPTPDQIAIIYELQRTGALHAEIIRQ